MKVVEEKLIDQIIDQLDSKEGYFDEQLEKASEDQPMIFAYMTSESFELLTEEEQGYLVYIGLIIYMAYKRTNPNLQDVSEDQIGDAEERNYELLDGASGETLNDRLDIFFEDYPQEALLALAEEAVSEDDEETVITPEAAEPIFVGLKSIIDAMMAATPAK